MVFLTTPTTTMTTKTFSIYCIIIQNKTRCTSYLLRCATLHKNGASICSVFVFTLRLFFFFLTSLCFCFYGSVCPDRFIFVSLSVWLTDHLSASPSLPLVRPTFTQVRKTQIYIILARSKTTHVS